MYKRVRDHQNEALCERASTYNVLIARSSATIPRHVCLKSRPADIAQEDITTTNTRTTNNGHSNLQTMYRGTPLQVAYVPKRMESEKKTKTIPASQQTTPKQDIRKPAPITLANAWATLTVQEVENRSFSCKSLIPITTTATIQQTMEVNTEQSKLTARNSQAEQRVETSKGGTRPKTSHQYMYKAACTINEGIFDSYISERFLSSNQCQPIHNNPLYS